MQVYLPSRRGSAVTARVLAVANIISPRTVGNATQESEAKTHVLWELEHRWHSGCWAGFATSKTIFLPNFELDTLPVANAVGVQSRQCMHLQMCNMRAVQDIAHKYGRY